MPMTDDMAQRAADFREADRNFREYDRGFFHGVIFASVLFVFGAIGALLFADLERNDYRRDNYADHGQ